jgi:hypothetical protein
VASWSPESGLVRVTGELVSVKQWLPPVYVAGPYVVIGKGHGAGTTGSDTAATVVDTRSGAVTYLSNRVAGADGGAIAFHLGQRPSKDLSMPGLVRSDALQPLTC